MKTISAIVIVVAPVSMVNAQMAEHFATVRTNSAMLDRSRNRASVPLQLSRPSAEFSALVRDGSKWRVATNVLNHSGGGANLEIEPNKAYFVMQNAPKPLPASGRAGGSQLLSSSLVLMGGKSAGPASSHTEIVSGNFFIRGEVLPVPYDAKQRLYQTDLKIGFDSTNSPRALQQLLPLAVQLSGLNVMVQPDSVTITQVGPVGYQTATVKTKKYTTQAVVIAHYQGTDQATD